MTDVNELLAEVRKGYTGDAFDDLDVEMMAGRWPNEWREAFVVNAAAVIEKKAKVIAELEVDRDRWKRRALAAEAGTRELQ